MRRRRNQRRRLPACSISRRTSGRTRTDEPHATSRHHTTENWKQKTEDVKLCFIMYQGNMYSGGQGVYLHYMTRELVRAGPRGARHLRAPVPAARRRRRPPPAAHLQLLGVPRRPRRARLRRRARSAFFHPWNFYEFASTRASLGVAVLHVQRARVPQARRDRSARRGRSTSCTTTRRSATASSR